jgi:hypothetical protein
MHIDLQDEKKKMQYRDLRHQKIHDFARNVRKMGADYFSIDECQDVFTQFFTFMKKRQK